MSKLAPSLLALCAAAALVLAWVPDTSALGKDKKKNRKPKYVEHVAGVVPTEWGDIVAVAGDFSKHTLVFRSEKGDIRIISLTGQKLPGRVTVVKRQY